MPGVFEFSVPGEEPVGLAGPWQAAAAAPVSFEAGAAPAPEDVPVWRANLPEDEAEARSALLEAETQLAAAEAALRGVPARLEAVTSSVPRGDGVSFDVSSFSVEPGTPEAELFAVLEHVQDVEQGNPVSYGIGDFASQAWEEARGQFEKFLGQIQREVLNLAWVETNAGTRPLARTSVGWSGDNQTVWLEGLSAQERSLHSRSLDLAVRSRLLRIRMFSTVTGGAAKLSILLVTPAGAVMALPAAWKYVTEILKQVKTYQTLTRGG
jgi:hypothetical protein